MVATVSSLISHWKMDLSLVAASDDENCRQIFIGGGGEKYRAVDVDDADDSGASMAEDYHGSGAGRVGWSEGVVGVVFVVREFSIVGGDGTLDATGGIAGWSLISRHRRFVSVARVIIRLRWLRLRLRLWLLSSEKRI